MFILAAFCLTVAIVSTWLLGPQRPRDTNGNDPRNSRSFEEWWEGWSPLPPSVITDSEGKAHEFKEFCKLVWIASAGQWEFSDVRAERLAKEDALAKWRERVLQEREDALCDEGNDE